MWELKVSSHFGSHMLRCQSIFNVKTLKIGWAFENCPTLVVTQVMLFKVDHSSYKVLHCMKKKKKTLQEIEQLGIDLKIK